jgi:outer membrane protein assembly factor BamB
MKLNPFVIATLLAAITAGTGAATLPELPQAATSFGAAVADGWVYVYGGNSGKAHEFHRECIKGDFFRLNLSNGKEWEKLPSDRPLLGAAMASYQGSIYRIGGMEARNEKGARNDIHSTKEVVRYVPASGQWESLPDLPDQRSSHDVAVLDNILYVAGGWKLTGGGSRDAEDSSGEWHKTMLSLDLANPTKGWTSIPQPFQRRALAVVAHENRLWFIGGMDSSDEPSLAVDWYEPKSGKWGKGADLPKSKMAGFGIAACSAGGEVLASPLSGQVYAIRDNGARWEELTKLAKPRFFHRMLPATADSVVVVGGSDRKGQIRDLELVSLKATAKTEPARTDAAPKTEREAKAPSEKTTTNAWPQWRGPRRDGISEEKGFQKTFSAEGPARLWNTNVGLGMTSCVVAGGRLFTQGNDGEDNDSVIALDAATGAELWRYSVPCATASHEMPIVPSGPGATATVVNNRVLALTREGDLLCLDASAGSLLWRKNLIKDLGGKRPVYGYSQSPLVVGDRIILDIGKEAEVKGSTVAISIEDGTQIWQAGKGEAGYSSARTIDRDGKQLIVMFKGEALEVLDPKDGTSIASYRTTARDFTNAATPAFVGHRILVSNTGTDQASLLDWNGSDNTAMRPVWQHKQFALLFNSAIFHEGSLFAFNEKRRGHHEFTCVDVETGESRWVSDAVATGTFIQADGHWIFLTRDGEVVIAPVSNAGLQPVARFKGVEGKCYATPTLADGRLYVRSNAGEIAAFDLRKAIP